MNRSTRCRLHVMGMKTEAAETTDYIARNLAFDKDISVSNFEITIRLLGSLVSNYQATRQTDPRQGG